MNVNFSTRATSFGFERCKLALGTVAPENVLGFRQFSDFVYPIEHGLIRRLGIADSIRRENGRCDIFHETKVSILSTNERLRHGESLDVKLFHACVRTVRGIN